ncbi:MAG: hypothetical protein ACKOC5_08585 [Chloroflexota bacterium]
MTFTMDTQLGELLNEPRVSPVLDKYVPGLASNPMVAMVKGMTLNQIISMPQAAQFGITREKVEALLAEANKVI